MRLTAALIVATLFAGASGAATLTENAETVTNLAAQIDAAIRAKGGTTAGGLAAAPAAILAIPTGGSIGPWFRWTYTEKYPAQGTLDVSTIALARLALFDENNQCVNLDLSKGSSATSLTAGQFWQSAGDGNAANVFTTSLATSAKWTGTASTIPVSFTMRLADSAAPVKYNLAVSDVTVTVGKTDLLGRYPTSWMLETSDDGVTWKVIDEKSGVKPSTTASSWYAGGGTGTTPTTFYGF